ncbi:ZIP family metal transporter [Mucilaginibacter sp.]
MLGGIFALRFRKKLYLILGFSAGALLGVVFFDLLPTAFQLSGAKYGMNTVGCVIALGFSIYMMLDRAIIVSNRSRKTNAGNIRGNMAAFSLMIHSLIDGISIGLAFQISVAIGGFVAVAVLVHDFADGINTINVIIKENGKRNSAITWLILNGLAPVIGGWSTFFYHLPQEKLGVLLALMAGFFIYIGASDFIPDSQTKSKGFKTSLLTLAGIAVIYLAVRFSGV